jgi:WD repeat-containing protein 35
MYIFRNVDPEEPITCSGCEFKLFFVYIRLSDADIRIFAWHLDLCSFENLQIKAALLDDIFREPDAPSKDFMLNIDSKSLRDTRSMDRVFFFFFLLTNDTDYTLHLSV